jgi:hypothetical protein
MSGYRLVVAQDAPPDNCNQGSLIYHGNARTFTHTGLTNGTLYGYRLCPSDLAGNVGPGSTVTVRPAPELEPPTGNLKINGGATVTSSENVTLNFTASDASGVARMCISNSDASCTSWETYAASKSWALPTQNGSTSVFVWYEDSYGNRSQSPVTANIFVDTAPPVDVKFQVEGGPGVIELSWTAASDPSGIDAYILVYVPEGQTPPDNCQEGTPMYQGMLRAQTHDSLNPDDKYHYRLCVRDRAGNVSWGVLKSGTAQ